VSEHKSKLARAAFDYAGLCYRNGWIAGYGHAMLTFGTAYAFGERYGPRVGFLTFMGLLVLSIILATSAARSIKRGGRP
jgi:hypothetical protein